MTLTRRDLIAKLKGLSYEINQLAQELESLPAAGPRGDRYICPLHKIPWINTQQGPSHKLTDGSGKWCNKDKLGGKSINK